MKYNIWAEGYDNRNGARKMGEVEANSFEQACDKIFKEDANYNAIRLSHWGCKLFDNELDAKRRHG
jgi:hypothetical protein